MKQLSILFFTATFLASTPVLAIDNPPVPTPSGNAQSDALAQALSAAFAGAKSNAKQAQRQGQRQSSRNDNRSSASASGGNQAVTIDNSNRQRMAANTAATVTPGGYGPANCFGDTNPSGSFGASMQVFGWGVAANSQKASNVCAVAALAGPAVALGYLQKMDPNVPRPVVVQQPTGRLICPDDTRLHTNGMCR